MKMQSDEKKEIHSRQRSAEEDDNKTKNLTFN